VSATQQRARTNSLTGWGELSLELAQINPLNPEQAGAELVAALARHFRTDRVSLIFFSGDDGAPGRMVSTSLPTGTLSSDDAAVALRARDSLEPLFIDEIVSSPRQEPASPRLKGYKTDGSALFPLRQDGATFAVLCLSNLSGQQLDRLRGRNEQLQLVLEQVRQLSLVLAGGAPPAARAVQLAEDELAVLTLLAGKLDSELETRSVFSRFCEMVGGLIPIEALNVIYAGEADDAPQAIACVTRAVHEDELRVAFAELGHQWQRRSRRAPLLSLAEAKLYGEELVRSGGECPPELQLGRLETFPVFIDNDLFALAAVATSAAILADRRRVQLLGFLLHQLMLYVKKSQLLELNSGLQTVDPLTGLYNERHFFQVLEREFDRAERYRVPLSLHVFDVDHFKDVNEAYGFETGDLLLREISRILMENIRTTDMVCRYGGKRFILLLPETHAKNGEILANRLRRYIENYSFYIPVTNVFIKATVSVGAASYLEHKPASAAQFIEFADTALYFAKRNGRNQVVGYGYVMSLMLGDSGLQG
jgi:diguanylate cyclase (GGDEF)-like protein